MCPGAVVGQAQAHPDVGLVGVHDGVVMDGPVIAQPHRDTVDTVRLALHVAALEYVDRFCEENNSKLIIINVKLHKRGRLLQTTGHPFPLPLGQPSSALLSTA